MLLRKEQRSVDRMIDLGTKFCSVPELITETCAETFETTKSCLQLSDHRRFSGCERDSERFRMRSFAVGIVRKAGFECWLPHNWSENAVGASEVFVK